MAEDPTENCKATDNTDCFKCKWHGICHKEAMMQLQLEGDGK